MANRTYPDTSKTNEIAETIRWFYVDFLGKKPDSTCYASGTRMLKDLFKPGPRKFPDARSYTSKEIADLFYYLREQGIIIDGLGIVKTANLLRSFVDKDKRVLQSKVNWFLEQQQTENSIDWDAPNGW